MTFEEVAFELKGNFCLQHRPPTRHPELDSGSMLRESAEAYGLGTNLRTKICYDTLLHCLQGCRLFWILDRARRLACLF